MRLDQVLGLTPSTVKRVVDGTRAVEGEIGHDKAHVEAEPDRFDARDGAALAAQLFAR